MATIYTDEHGRKHIFSNYSIRKLAHIWAFCPGEASEAAESCLKYEHGFVSEDFELIERVLLLEEE